jgi:hypothetical protein
MSAILRNFPVKLWIVSSWRERFDAQFRTGAQQFREQRGDVFWSRSGWPPGLSHHAIEPKTQTMIGSPQVF